jgi:spermidine synthase
MPLNLFWTKEKYDLIIIDVFQDTKMPNFLYENYFINRICLLLKSKGFVLFNTMLLNEEHNLRNKNTFQISAPNYTT